MAGARGGGWGWRVMALTLWPWWALSIRDHGKRVENRGWAPVRLQVGHLGERIAIHAGVRVPTRDDLDSWLLTIGLADRAAHPELAPLEFLSLDTDDPAHIRFLRAAIAEVAGRVICTARLVGVDRDQRTPWDVPGQWHWRLADVERVEGQPVVRGRLGLWDWQPEVEVDRG